MKVYGVEITDEQQAAGIAAMQGQFRMGDIVAAMVRAGSPAEGYVTGRAVDRLLQKERRAGRIRAVNNKLWERVGEPA